MAGRHRSTQGVAALHVTLHGSICLLGFAASAGCFVCLCVLAWQGCEAGSASAVLQHARGLLSWSALGISQICSKSGGSTAETFVMAS
jgi:hypothetical protein